MWGSTDIGERTFAEWFAARAAAVPAEKNIEQVAESLWLLVERGTLRLPRGGYVVRRDRCRIVVKFALRLPLQMGGRGD